MPNIILSINGGSSITVGQTGIPITATGFTAKPTGDHTQSPAASPVGAWDISFDNIFISRFGFYEGV